MLYLYIDFRKNRKDPKKIVSGDENWPKKSADHLQKPINNDKNLSKISQNP